MDTMEAIVLSYWLFLVALFYFYAIVHCLSDYYFTVVEEEDDDMEPGDDDHCCRICHEDIRAFSDILRLSKCQRIRSSFSQLKRYTY